MHNALIPKAKMEDIIAVDQFSREARNEIAKAQAADNPMMVALMTARALNGLRELVTNDMMSDVMGLMNSQLGFLTDRDPTRPDKHGNRPEPYPVDIVKDSFITAQMWGARPVGNEFNIISNRAYRTVGYYRRKVTEVPGVSEVSWQVSSPEMSSDGKVARLTAACTWKQNGQQRRRVCAKDATGDWRVSVRVNYGMGEAAIKGKAERAILALALADMENRHLDEGDLPDPDDERTINGTVVGAVTTVEVTPDAPTANTAAEQFVNDLPPPPADATKPQPAGQAPQQPREWWVEKLKTKTTSKAAAAWVQFAHENNVDITAEGDQLIKALVDRRNAKEKAAA